MPGDFPPQTLIVGLSGPSSSGKTTLARLLRSIFNTDTSAPSKESTTAIRLFIIHEDDFYKTDAEIPTIEVTSKEHGTRTLQDWDCVESLDLPLLERTLNHVKRHGTSPPDMISKEDQNSVGDSGIAEGEIERYRREIINWFDDDDDNGIISNGGTDVGAGMTTGHQSPPSTTATKKNKTRQINICILDGFLLYPPPPLLSSSSPTSSSKDETTTNTTTTHQHNALHTLLSTTLDLKLFLPCTRSQTIRRRAARTGYVTMEGFWADPPGYVEDVVWPNYTRDHLWMFGGAERSVDAGLVDVEGEVVRREGIVVGPGPGSGSGMGGGGGGGGSAREDKDEDEDKRGAVEMEKVLAWGMNVLKGKIQECLRG